MQEGAGLIFITYTQLLEPSVRSSGGFGPIFKNAIVIIDEVSLLMLFSINKSSYFRICTSPLLTAAGA